MSENLKVSVILPVYNVERYLPRCMDDILGQTLKEMEVIAIDDGSTDQSLKILRKYEAQDERVQVLTQQNAGAAAARNRGLAMAKGRYVSFLDSDDFFEPQMLEKAFAHGEKTGAEVTIFRGNRYDDQRECYVSMDYSIKREQLPGKDPFCWKDLPDRVFTFGVGWAWDKLYRRDFLEREKLTFQELRTSNDLYFVFSSLVKAKSISTMEDLLVHHRIHIKGSLSVTREKSWHCFYEATRALQQELIKDGIYRELEKGFTNWAIHFCYWNLDTIQGAAYEKVYDLIKGTCCQEFGLLDHGRDWYVQKELYDRLVKMQDMTCVEYLLYEREMLRREDQRKQQQIQELIEENRAVKQSATFRAGRVLTALPGKIKRGIRGEK